MSYNNTNTNDLNTAVLRPEHHVHDSSDPLPGNRGVQSVDYSADTIERTGPTSNWSERDERQFAAGQTHHEQPRHHERHDQHQGQVHNEHSTGQNAFNSERPMNVQPTNAGGVAVEGRNDLPMGHASAADKIIGKTQKVIGKMSHNPEMHEKGELRESGGKQAAQGRARAPHD